MHTQASYQLMISVGMNISLLELTRADDTAMAAPKSLAELF